MLWEHQFEPDDRVGTAAACKALVDAWGDHDKKVFVLRASKPVESVRDFYESIFPFLGSPRALAEDVNVGDRNHQRTGEIWSEVRYDPKFPDAYRHSANAQPLHTDGSYIPTYSNSTLLACVANAGTGGETTFLDLSDLTSILESDDPTLLRQLQTIVVPHARSGDRRDSRIIENNVKGTKIYFNYYCVANDANHEARELAAAFREFLASSPKVARRTKSVKLQPGDGVFWKDDEVLHGRNGFVANHTSERFIWKCAFDVGIFS